MTTNTNFKQIKLQHANLHKEVTLLLGSIAMYHFSDTAKATYVYTHAGIVPVKESSDEITSMINNLTKGENDE